MTLQEEIKEYALGLRADILVGFAGHERLHGPPSLDPSYTMAGARSIVALAVPMDVPAIYDFLAKKTPDTHNADQLHGNQEVFRISMRIAEFLEARGHRACAAPVNSDYRRSPDLLSFHPRFSHRFGAIAAGIAGQGWSGNAVTREYGASVYLGTVVTDAELTSERDLDARAIHDQRCSKCKMCEKSCPVGMFERDREEQVLLNGKLYPRGKRVNVDLCTTSCFGMHALSRDKRWTTWSPHWIREWIDGVPNPRDKLAVRRAFLRKAGAVGDSGRRTYLIQQLTIAPLAEETVDIVPRPRGEPDYYEKHVDRRGQIESEFARAMGVADLRGINVLTCGQCALVCGPTLKERGKRFKMLRDGGYVVPGPDGAMVHTHSYDEAVAVRAANRSRSSARERRRDQWVTLRRFVAPYLGVAPGSVLRGLLYQLRRRRALRRARVTSAGSGPVRSDSK